MVVPCPIFMDIPLSTKGASFAPIIVHLVLSGKLQSQQIPKTKIVHYRQSTHIYIYIYWYTSAFQKITGRKKDILATAAVPAKRLPWFAGLHSPLAKAHWTQTFFPQYACEADPLMGTQGDLTRWWAAMICGSMIPLVQPGDRTTGPGTHTIL